MVDSSKLVSGEGMDLENSVERVDGDHKWLAFSFFAGDDPHVAVDSTDSEFLRSPAAKNVAFQLRLRMGLSQAGLDTNIIGPVQAPTTGPLATKLKAEVVREAAKGKPAVVRTVWRMIFRLVP